MAIARSSVLMSPHLRHPDLVKLPKPKSLRLHYTTILNRSTQACRPSLRPGHRLVVCQVADLAQTVLLSEAERIFAMTVQGEQFAGISEESWVTSASRLSETGAFADEEGGNWTVAYPALQAKLDTVERMLRQHGYAGGPILLHSFDEPEEGASYVIYDSSR